MKNKGKYYCLLMFLLLICLELSGQNRLTVTEIEEVVISAEGRNANVSRAEMSIERITAYLYIHCNRKWTKTTSRYASVEVEKRHLTR